MSGWADYGFKDNIFFLSDLYRPMLGLMKALRERLAIAKEYGHISNYDDNNPSFDIFETNYYDTWRLVKNKVEALMLLDLNNGYNSVSSMYKKIDFEKAMKLANRYLESYGLPNDYYQAFSISNIGVISTNQLLPNEPAFILFSLYYCVNLIRYLVTNSSSYKSEFKHYELELSYIRQYKTVEELQGILPSTLGGWISYIKSNGQVETYQEQGFRPMIGFVSVDWTLDTWGEYVDSIKIQYTELQKVFFNLEHPIIFDIRPYDDNNGGFLGFNRMPAGETTKLKLSGDLPVESIQWDNSKQFAYGHDGFEEGKWNIISSWLDIFDLPDLEFKDTSAFEPLT